MYRRPSRPFAASTVGFISRLRCDDRAGGSGQRLEPEAPGGRGAGDRRGRHHWSGGSVAARPHGGNGNPTVDVVTQVLLAALVGVGAWCASLVSRRLTPTAVGFLVALLTGLFLCGGAAIQLNAMSSPRWRRARPGLPHRVHHEVQPHLAPRRLRVQGPAVLLPAALLLGARAPERAARHRRVGDAQGRHARGGVHRADRRMAALAADHRTPSGRGDRGGHLLAVPGVVRAAPVAGNRGVRPLVVLVRTR